MASDGRFALDAGSSYAGILNSDLKGLPRFLIGGNCRRRSLLGLAMQLPAVCDVDCRLIAEKMNFVKSSNSCCISTLLS
jgi:hypothetical protein